MRDYMMAGNLYGLYYLKREKSKESCVSSFLVEMGMYPFFSLRLVWLGQTKCNKKAEPKLRQIDIDMQVLIRIRDLLF